VFEISTALQAKLNPPPAYPKKPWAMPAAGRGRGR